MKTHKLKLKTPHVVIAVCGVNKHPDSKYPVIDQDDIITCDRCKKNK